MVEGRSHWGSGRSRAGAGTYTDIDQVPHTHELGHRGMAHAIAIGAHRMRDSGDTVATGQRPLPPIATPHAHARAIQAAKAHVGVS